MKKLYIIILVFLISFSICAFGSRQVVAQSSGQFTFSTISSPQTAGTPFSITITVTVGGNPDTSYAGIPTLSVSTGTISPTVTGAFSKGVWTGTVTVTGSGSSITIKATDSGFTGTSNSFTVNAGALDHFVFSNIGTQTAGTAFSTTITAKDSNGNTVTSYTGTNTLSVSSGTISPTTTTKFTSGSWTGSVTLTQSGTGISISTVGNSKSGTSSTFTVNSGALDHFVFNSVGTPQTAGTAFSITITAKDVNGNTVASYVSTNSLSVSSGTISPTTTTAFTGGSWTGSVTLTQPGTGISISTSGGSGRSGTSNSFSVSAGALDHFVFGNIGTQTAGTAFSTTITAKDSNGNTVTSYTGTPTLSVSTGTINPTVTAAFSNGVWTGTVTVTGAGSSITITATDGTVTGSSNSFTVNAGAVANVVISPTGSSVAAGSSETYSATASDAYNNNWDVTSSTTWSINSGAGGSWSSNVYTSAIAGSWSVTGTYASKNYTADLTVNPGATTQLVVSSATPQVAGAAFSATVTAEDVFNNTATGYSGTVKITSSDSLAVLPTNYVFQESDAGVHSFSVTLKTAGSQSITATDTTTSLITGSQTGITVIAAGAVSFIVSGFPSSTVAGVAHTVTVTAKDAANNTVTGYSGTVKITSSDGKAVLPGNSVLTSGVGTFSVTLETTGSQVVTATDTVTNSITGSQSSIQVNPSVFDQFGIGVPGTVTAGSTFGSITVAAYDAYNNVKTDYTGSIYFTSSDSAATLPYNSSSKYLFVSGDGGVHTFSGFTLQTTPSQTITVTDGSLSKQSTSITVNAGTLDHFVFNSVGAQTAGSAFSIKVTAMDKYGNIVSGYVGTPSLTCSAGSITPTTMNAFVSGVGSTSVTLTNAGSGVNITATDSTRIGTSNTFTVTVAPTPTPTATPTANPTPTSSPSPTATPTTTPSSSSSPDATPTPAPNSQLSFTTSVQGEGTITPAPGTYTHEIGDQIALNATPAQGYVFSYWLLQDGSRIPNATTTLTLTFSQTAVAVFAPQSESTTSLSIYLAVVVTFFLINAAAYVAIIHNRRGLRKLPQV